MTNAEIEAVLAAAITSCLAASGKAIVEINPDTVPLNDIAGFDSLCAVEVLVDIESRCGLKAESDVFLEGRGSKARNRTIREIAAAIKE
jgi:acyl carrier protein